MVRHNLPTADNVLLVYLVSILALVATFASLTYWLTLPTVLPNAGMAAFEREQRVAAILLPRAPEIDIEKPAMALAQQENEKQGLRSAAVAHQETPSPSVRQAATNSARNPPKPRRVARAERRHPAYDDALNSWAYAPGRAGYGSFPGFGTWFR